MVANQNHLFRLLKLGFIPVGNWLFDDKRKIRLTLTSNQNASNLLYAFVSNGEIKCIGKKTKTTNNRMHFYQNPGISPKTNIRVNGLIPGYLKRGKTVDIFALIDNALLSDGGYIVNLAAGLEDSPTYEISPEWNFNGNKRIVKDKASEEPKEIPTTSTTLSAVNFEIPLNQTYYNRGFFNVPTEFSKYFGENNATIELSLNGGQPILGYINRQANRNGTPEMGKELQLWI